MNRLLPARGRAARRLARGLRAAKLALVTALVVALPVAACSETETETVAGKECVGGVMVDGQCHPKCDPEKCLDGNVCVDNECKLVCLSHRDCDTATQACTPPVEGTEVVGDLQLVNLAWIFGVCESSGERPVPGANGFGAPCPDGIECSAFACPNGLQCEPLACSDANGVPHPDWCLPDPVACGDIVPCNIGLCENPFDDQDLMNGLPCTVTTCPFNECTPFFCVSAGPSDAEAYCTHHDCSADADCPAGWYCGVTRDPHEICGVANKGNNGICGETFEPCIGPEQFNIDGKQFFEGQYCLLRRTCLPRESCVPCENNLDCSLDPQAVCLPIAEEVVCARYCATHDDCYGDEMCSPSYTTCEYSSTLPCGDPMPASEACPQFPCIEGLCATLDGQPGAPCTTSQECARQACVERLICMPRHGACRGAGGFCEPCLDDTDCGDLNSPTACSEVTDGQHACFDFSFPHTCPSGSDNECPVAPSGAHGECLDSAEGVDPGHQLYHRCYFPFSIQKDRFSCWPFPM